MKKFLLCALAALLVLTASAFAEYDEGIWEIYEAEDGLTRDFDNDETAETLHFTFELDEYDDGGFTIGVGGQSLHKDDCIGLDARVLAMKTGYTYYYYGTLFMVSEYGPSDDPITYCFLYAEGKLTDIGMIPALAQSFEVSKDGLITTYVRANMIGTWSRPADFCLAMGSEYDEEGDWAPSYSICEVPRPMYQMGMIVTLKTDLVLSSSLYESREDVMLMAGQKVILVAGDDVSRLYISSLDGLIGGWAVIMSEDWSDYISVNGSYTDADEVFDGIFYAD